MIDKHEDGEWRMEDGGRGTGCVIKSGCGLRVAWGIGEASGCARLGSLSPGLLGNIFEFRVAGGRDFVRYLPVKPVLPGIFFAEGAERGQGKP